VKLDVDGKRVSIPESMCQKVLDKLLVVNNTPSDIFISQRDPSYKSAAPCSHRPRAIHSRPTPRGADLSQAVVELGGRCVASMTRTSIMIASPQAVEAAPLTGDAVVFSSGWLVKLVR
jgi:hypothetical protein